MDKQRLYFQTLLVLCERRLTDATAVVVPSDQQVCDRLRETGLDPSATPKMVERRLADAREHLGLSLALLEQRGVPNSSLRSLIVDTAIATGAVRTHDLQKIGLA